MNEKIRKQLKKMNPIFVIATSLLIIVVLLLVLILASTAVSCYVDNKKIKDTFGSLSGWKMFSDQKYGFEFKHPFNWIINDNRSVKKTSNKVIISPFDIKNEMIITISIIKNPNLLSIHDWVNNYLDISSTMSKSLLRRFQTIIGYKVNGLPAYRNIAVWEKGKTVYLNAVPVIGYYVSFDDKIYLIEMVDYDASSNKFCNGQIICNKALKLFDQIVSTFRFFTPVTSVNPHVYYDKTHNFKFEYPFNWGEYDDNLCIKELEKKEDTEGDSGTFCVRVYPQKEVLEIPLSKWIKNRPILRIADETIGVLQTKRALWWGAGGHIVSNVFDYKGVRYELEWNLYDDNTDNKEITLSPTMKQILSTFKFLD